MSHQPTQPSSPGRQSERARLLPTGLSASASPAPLLCLELVPATCWGSSFRDLVSDSGWGRIRRAVYDAAGHRCEICGGAGRRHTVECHERWSYDDAAHLQRLDRFIALCPRCHAVKHLGRTGTVAKAENKAWVLEAAERHVCRVNGWSRRQLDAAYDSAWEEWSERSRHHWRLDLAVLARYGFSAAQIAGLEADADQLRRELAAEAALSTGAGWEASPEAPGRRS